MSRTESSQQASLLPFLQPSGCAPRLALTEGVTDASYPFAVVDNSAPFSRVIRGSFLTDGGSRLKDVFLVLQRDRYHLENTAFSKITNIEIEASWVRVKTRASAGLCGDGLIELASHLSVGEKSKMFAPLLFCREKQLFLPLLCPSCSRELELCSDDELLQHKGLHPYSTSVRRYLYCPSCSNSAQSEFFVREREDSDPLFLSDGMDLLRRLLRHKDGGVGNNAFPCASCSEQDTCYGDANSVRSRLLPLSFYPFHMMIVAAPALNALDFTSLVSGADTGGLSRQIDRRAFPGRFFSLKALETAGPVKWTNFTQADERGFLELLFLKLSLLEEVVGKIAADPETALRGERVWVYLPRVCRNLPMGWNFRLLFIDDITPVPATHELERSPSLALARAGLFYFQVLLGSGALGADSIAEAVSQYLSGKSDEGGSGGMSLLKAMCVPANMSRDPDGYIANRLGEDCWHDACSAGFALLDAARSRSSMNCTEIRHSLQNLLEVVRAALYSTVKVTVESAPAVAGLDDREAKLAIHRVVSDMIASCRSEVHEKPAVLPAVHFDEVVETVILRSGAAVEPPVAEAASSEDAATVILAAPPPVQEKAANILPDPAEDELQETVIMSAQRPEEPVRETAQPRPPAAVPPPSVAAVPEQDDDLAETVMIVPPAGRNRPGGYR